MKTFMLYFLVFGLLYLVESFVTLDFFWWKELYMCEPWERLLFVIGICLTGISTYLLSDTFKK